MRTKFVTFSALFAQFQSETAAFALWTKFNIKDFDLSEIKKEQKGINLETYYYLSQTIFLFESFLIMEDI